MKKTHPNYEHAQTLAGAVRALARDARRALGGLDVREVELTGLVQRIDLLRKSPAARDHAPILRWLDNLRREVEAARVPALIS
jgi:hypothetical protein